MSKTKRVTSNPSLLRNFARSLANWNLSNFAIHVDLGNGSTGSLRLKAPHQTERFAIRARLNPSRDQLLRRPQESSEKPFILLCPHIPERLASDFRKEQINHADLNGRLFIQTSSLLIDREPKERCYGNPTVEPDLFSPKASRIVCSLLSHEDRDWEQAQLAEQTHVSPGLVSRILQTLIRDGYVSRKGTATRHAAAKYRLKDFDRLLDAWKREDDWSRRVEIQQYSLLADDVHEIARTVSDALGDEQLLFTQWFAADLRHPYTTPPVVSAYFRKPDFPDLPFARKVDTGGNFWLLSPRDEGVFFEFQESSGYKLVADVQIYLDLLQVGQRGPDQASALRQWEGFAK